MQRGKFRCFSSTLKNALSKILHNLLVFSACFENDSQQLIMSKYNLMSVELTVIVLFVLAKVN